MNDYRKYENGIADVLTSIAGEAAKVERDVHLPSKKGGGTRQIDVLVHGRIFGLTNATLIVDCKNWKENIDISDVDGLIGLVEDVNADVGMLIAVRDASETAKHRAKNERGVRVVSASVIQLNAWRPPGTVSREIGIAPESEEIVASALRKKGLLVARSTNDEPTEHRVVLDVFRHYGTRHPSGEVQSAQHEKVDNVLAELHVPPP